MIKSATELSSFYVPPPSEAVELVRHYIVTHKSTDKKAYTACLLPPQGSVTGNKITPYWS